MRWQSNKLYRMGNSVYVVMVYSSMFILRNPTSTMPRTPGNVRSHQASSWDLLSLGRFTTT